MQGPEERKVRKCQLGYTKNNAAQDLEECEEKEEHLHYTELRTSQEKKQRKKCKKKKVPDTLKLLKIHLLCIVSDNSNGS